MEKSQIEQNLTIKNDTSHLLKLLPIVQLCSLLTLSMVEEQPPIDGTAVQRCGSQWQAIINQHSKRLCNAQSNMN